MPLAIKPNPTIKVQLISIFCLSIAAISQISMGCVPLDGRQNGDSLFLVTSEKEIYYDLKNPSEKYKLPYVLEEVSGLSFAAPNRLVMLEDEGGKVYEYDYNTREIVSSTSFAKPGDYEGIELVNSVYYAIKSNGELYKFDRNEGKTAESKKINTPLTRKNDVEGLGYDIEDNRLLIVTKANGDFKDHSIKGNGVFSYDLKKKNFKKNNNFLSVSNTT